MTFALGPRDRRMGYRRDMHRGSKSTAVQTANVKVRSWHIIPVLKRVWKGPNLGANRTLFA